MCFFKNDVTNRDVGSNRCSTEVEEERQCVRIVLGQGDAHGLIDVWLIGLHVMAVSEIEVVVVLGLIIGLGEFDGDTVSIIVG